MDPCWKNLPCELVEKICNYLPKVRRIENTLSEDIRNQWYKFDRWHFNYGSLFGFNNVYYVMYDDLKNWAHINDNYPEEMPLEDVVKNMWMTLTSEHRDVILMTY